MNKTNIFLIVWMCALWLMLSSCVSGTPGQVVDSDETGAQTENVERLPMPFSNGPSAPPSVKGPNMPVPEAVTETETAEFRLPEENGS